MNFIGRTEELLKFEDRYDSVNSELVFLYGRRRVGKTEFLRKFAEDKNAFFYSATESVDNEQRERFKQKMLSFGFDGEPALLNDWESMFRNLTKLRTAGRTLVIIDEFQHIFMGKKAVPSILQNIWDEYLSKENIMLILCGSAMSFIEKKILGSKNPLYGRATAIFRMKELPFEEASQFFPGYTLKEKIIAYSILGGIPFYLKQFSQDLSIEENIRKNILSDETVLYNEIEFLLKQELRETATYNTIISAVALGNTKLNEIAQKTSMETAKVNVYLKNLIDLSIVGKEYSITDAVKKDANIRNGRYKISDKFFRFWYRFVYPNKNEIEIGDTSMLAREVTEIANMEHASICFEELCVEYVIKQNSLRKLPFKADRVGRVWGKTFEIDLGATDGKSILLGECKWTNSKVGAEELNDLKGKVMSNRELAGYKRHIFCLFSRSGFTKTLTENITDDVILIDVNDMFRA